MGQWQEEIPAPAPAGEDAARLVKHGFDRAFAALALILLLPLVAGAAALVLASRGPLVVRERRVGERGREFDLLRFRCPTAAADGPAIPTRAGRLLRGTGLEELPQLVNVLRGELSFVGPRPERVALVRLHGGQRGLRSLVRPGLTGSAQIAALNGLPAAAAGRKADDQYVRSWSLGLDARILARTVTLAVGR